MSQKSRKLIRKHLRQELKGQARVEAKWIFPVLFMQFRWYIKTFLIDGTLRIKLPWIMVVKNKKGWFEVTKFPPRQFRFRFRFIREAVLSSGQKIKISK